MQTGDLQILQNYDRALTVIPFPLSAGSSWSETANESVRAFWDWEQTVTVHGEVEGWGNLVLPDRTVLALRVRRSMSALDHSGCCAATNWTEIDFLTNDGYRASIIRDWGGLPFIGLYSHIPQGQGVGREEVADVEFRLLRNYPNPVRDVTVIPIEVATPGAISLSVIDLLGREVARPLHGHLAVGVHDISLDASELPNGIYLYRLSSGAGVRTGQMVVRR